MSAACSKKHEKASQCPLYGQLLVTRVPPWKNGPAELMLDLGAYSRAHDASVDFFQNLNETARSQKRGHVPPSPRQAHKNKKNGRRNKPTEVII